MLEIGPKQKTLYYLSSTLLLGIVVLGAAVLMEGVFLYIPWHDLIWMSMIFPITLAAYRFGMRGAVIAGVLATIAVWVWDHSHVHEAFRTGHLSVVAGFLTTYNLAAALGAGALVESMRYRQTALERSNRLLRDLAENEARIAAIMDNVPDGIFTFDEQGIIDSCNPAAQRIFGYASAEIVGQSVGILLSGPDPVESPEHLFDRLPMICRRAEGGQGIIGIGCEVAGRRKGGAIFPMDLAISGMRVGEQQIFIGVVRDISERKHMEQQILLQATALESAANAIVISDREGTIIWANPSFTRLTGYTVKEVLDQCHLLFHSGGNDPQFYQDIRDAILTGQVWHGEVTSQRKNGDLYTEEMTITPVRDAQGEITHFITIKQDVTERRAMERMKDEFVSVVSHELRTPLTSIRGSLGLLASGMLGSLTEKGQRMLEIAVNNTDRLVRLIGDILDIERIESGRVLMDKRVCDASDLMLQACELMQSMAEKEGVTLSVTPQPARLWADPDRIIQILTNLLSNAIKFSSPGATVWLAAERQGAQMLFQVRDHGRGIPLDKLESIFGRFQQVDASDSREKGGTGLGLAICRSIVQQHGGHTWAESTMGEGSTFFFTLPTLKEEGDLSVPAEDHDGPVVLVCDDDPSIRTVVQAMLEQRSYRVVTAASGQEAVELAASLRPAAILLDLLMPGMDGWETLATIKERPDTRDIPVIILSVLQPESGAARRSQVVDWVSKPFDEKRLFQALKQAIGQQDKAPRVLVVEDDSGQAQVLIAIFQRHGIETFHARTGLEAIRLSECLTPDLLVLDLALSDGDGFAVVNWLRQHDRLRQVPLVVYSTLVVYSPKDLDASEQECLQSGQTQLLTKARITPEEFEQRVIGLLDQVIMSGRE